MFYYIGLSLLVNFDLSIVLMNLSAIGVKCNKNGFANIIIGYGATTGIGGGGGSCIGPHIKLIKGDCPLLLAHCPLHTSTGPEVLAHYTLVQLAILFIQLPAHNPQI